MNQQRRIFRGRGGATDRRLPKHQARKRNPHPSDEEVPKEAKYATPPPNQLRAKEIVNDENATNSERLKDSCLQEESKEQLDTASEKEETVPEIILPEDVALKKQHDAFLGEIRHVQQRLRRNQEAFSLTKDATSQHFNALDHLPTYQSNVLEATLNCAREWKAIVRHYPEFTSQCSYPAVEVVEDHDDDEVGGDGESSEDGDEGAEEGERMTETKLPLKVELDCDAQLCKETGRAMFELVQQAMQCGPLAGSNPGYFGRCGSEVAAMVLAFLETLMVDHAAFELHWSPKQNAAIEKWKKAAAKTADRNCEPSKHVSGKMKKALKKNQAKQQKKSAKAAELQARSK